MGNISTIILFMITIPTFFLVPVLISLLLFIVLILQRSYFCINPKRKCFWISLIVFLLIYVFIVGCALFDDLYFQSLSREFDLNKDGIIDSSEDTIEYQIISSKLINDTGRNFSVFTGLIFSAFIAIPSYLLCRGIDKYRRLRNEV